MVAFSPNQGRFKLPLLLRMGYYECGAGKAAAKEIHEDVEFEANVPYLMLP
jgi:hypothetical protein